MSGATIIAPMMAEMIPAGAMPTYRLMSRFAASALSPTVLLGLPRTLEKVTVSATTCSARLVA